MAFVIEFPNSQDIQQIRIQRVKLSNLQSGVFTPPRGLQCQIVFKKPELMDALSEFSLPKTAKNNISLPEDFLTKNNLTITLKAVTAGDAKSLIQTLFNTILKTLFDYGLLHTVVDKEKNRHEKDQCMAFFEMKYPLDVFSNSRNFIAEIAPNESKVIVDGAAPKSKL